MYPVGTCARPPLQQEIGESFPVLWARFAESQAVPVRSPEAAPSHCFVGCAGEALLRPKLQLCVPQPLPTDLSYMSRIA